MVRIPESRIDRRRRARLEALAIAMTPQLPKEMRDGSRPRYGMPMTPEGATEREKYLRRFGPKADERKQPERRVKAMTETEVKDWLKRHGINDGEDRRKAERRIR